MRERIAATFLRTVGWRAEGAPPGDRKCVVLAAPHTSNWDLPYMLAFAWRFGLRPSFMMKHSVFRGPAGPGFRRLGGIAIDRRAPGGLVKQMQEAFAATDDLVLVIPPEGTRERVEMWKSGFYHIARAAEVPLVLSYLDASRKVGGFGPAFHLTGNIAADMDVIRDFYADKVGFHPESFGEIRLREESP